MAAVDLVALENPIDLFSLPFFFLSIWFNSPMLDEIDTLSISFPAPPISGPPRLTSRAVLRSFALRLYWVRGETKVRNSRKDQLPFTSLSYRLISRDKSSDSCCYCVPHTSEVVSSEIAE